MILDQEKIARIKKILKFKSRGMSISEIALQLHMNRNSVAKYLEILLMNGEVEAKKLGTSKVYTVSQRVPVSGWIGFSSDMIVIINPEGQVLQANDSFLKFCTITSDEIIGEQIKDSHNPLFREIPLDNFLTESQEKKTAYCEISIDYKGQEYFFRVKLVPIIFDDGNEGILIDFEDISDKKRAEIALVEREQQYRAVIENIQDVFYRSDKDGNLIMASPSWASMLGYDSLAECLGKNIADVFYWDPEKRKPFLDMVFAQGRVNDYEVTLKTKDGNPFFVSTNSHPYFDNAGNPLGVEGVFRDINERHASAEKIRNHVARMEFFSRALQDFIELPSDANIFEKIAHDLKDLLQDAGILVFSYDGQGTLSIESALFDQNRNKITIKPHGRDLVGFAVQITTLDFSSLQTGELFRLPQALHQTFLREIIDQVCIECPPDTRFGTSYAIGLVCEESLLGSVVILGQSDKNTIDKDSVQTYIHQASIALKRCLAEHALKKSEELFSNIAQNSPLAIAIIDPDGTYRYINHNFTQIFGFDLKDFQTGREWFLLAYPDQDYRKNVISTWKSDLEHSASGDQRPRTYKVRCKNGAEKDIYFMPVTLSDGKQCVVYEDITNRREAEHVRRLLSFIVESTDDGVIGKTPEGIIISWNHAAERMFGYTRNEIVGRHISTIVPHKKRGELDEILKKIMQGTGISNLQTQRVRKDGEIIEVELTISPIVDEEGQTIGASTISRDITFRKAEERLQYSEEKYRTLVDNINIGVYRSSGDPKGKFVWGNPSLVEILGYSSLDHLKVIPIADLFAKPGGREKLLADLRESGFVKNREILLKRADGKKICVSVTAVARIGENGRIELINGIVQDITHTRELENQIKEINQEFGNIIESIPDPVFTLNEKREVSLWNAAMEQITGVKKEEIVGKSNYAQVIPFFGPSSPLLVDLINATDDDIQRLNPDLPARNIHREGSFISGETFVPVLYGNRGGYLWEKAGPLTDDKGKRTGAIEIIRDISPMKELQELLKHAKNGFVSDTLMKISNPEVIDPVHQGHDERITPGVLSLLYLSNALKMAQDSISILDLSGRCIWMNDAFACTLSQKKNDGLIGKSIARFIAPEDRKGALDCLTEVRKSGNKRIALSLLTSSGRIPAEASLSSINDSDGQILGYLTIIRHTEQDRDKHMVKNGILEKQLPKKRVSKV
jgi:PAS domain S-box-containing protein